MRRLSGADGDERKLDAGLAEPDLVTGMNAHALGHALAIHHGAEVAVVDEYELVAVADEGAVTAGDAGEAVGQREAVGEWRARELRNGRA